MKIVSSPLFPHLLLRQSNFWVLIFFDVCYVTESSGEDGLA